MTGPYMTITAVKEELTGISGVVKRTFLLAKTANPADTREVCQFQYGGWPDNGVPSSSEPIRTLIKEIITLRGNNPAPIVVHCSAGVGRTGAFCTIYTQMLRIIGYIERQEDDFPPREAKKNRDDPSSSCCAAYETDTLRNSGSLLKTNLTASYGPQSFYSEDSSSTITPLVSSSSFLDVDQPLTFNIFETVLTLRRCRSGMVQNVDQYMFCYKAIIDELRFRGLLPSDEPTDGSSSEEERKNKSDLCRPTPYEKVETAALSPVTLKQNHFSSRATLLTSIDLGCLNASPSQKSLESSSFDAEFHPPPNFEGASLTKSLLLTQSTIGNNLTASTIHGNPLLQDCRQHSAVSHPTDSVHSAAARSIPIRPRTQPTLMQQSPTLTIKPVVLTSDESQISNALRPVGAERSNRLLNGMEKEQRIPPSSLLTRSAITPSISLMSTSAPAQRNPMLLGRSPGASPGGIPSPLL